MSELFKFLKSKVFFINLLIAFFLSILFIYMVYTWMGKTTHHGESIVVPDLRGIEVENLDTLLANQNLRYQVVDSLFDGSKPGGTVLEQDPAPESKVKENRTIYLTLNSALPPKVKMPDLIDVSFRQAEAILQTFGLKIGDLSYEPDLAKNAILEQKYKGSRIKPGTEIFKGSAIDLVLGDGLGSIEVPVPQLIGLTYEEATFVLKGSSLNFGGVIYDPGVRDTADALIYKQIPASGANSNINQGGEIDVFLK